MEDAKNELKKRLGREPRKDILTTLDRYAIIEDYELTGNGDELESRYRELNETFPPSEQITASSSTQKSIQSDKRSETLSIILAKQMDRDPGVVSFRKNTLWGRLLKYEDVPAWIDRRSSSPVENTRELLFVRDDMVAWKYADPDGVLGELARVVNRLFHDHPILNKEDLTMFVLTGANPYVFPAGFRIHNRRKESFSRINVTADPRLEPKEVADLYSDARNRYYQGKPRRNKLMSDKRLELAIFGAEYGEESNWEELMKKWNYEHIGEPDLMYDNRWNFSREVRGAGKSMIGERM